MGEEQVLQGQLGAMGSALDQSSCSMTTEAYAISAVSGDEPPVCHERPHDCVRLPHPLLLDTVGEVTSVPGGLGAAGVQTWLLLVSLSWSPGAAVQEISDADGSEACNRA